MSMKMKLFAATAAAALLGAITAVPASATQYSQNSTPGFTITAGVGPRFDRNFNNVTMNGTPQLTSAVIAPFTVIDDSGSGAGWHVTLLLPNFADAATPAHVVSATGAQMNAPVVAAANTDSVMGGVWASPNVDFTSAKTLVHADPADLTHSGGAPVGPDGVTTVAGMGTYLVSPQILKLIVPANSIAASYTSAATIAIVNGP